MIEFHKYTMVRHTVYPIRKSVVVFDQDGNPSSNMELTQITKENVPVYNRQGRLLGYRVVPLEKSDYGD